MLAPRTGVEPYENERFSASNRMGELAMVNIASTGLWIPTHAYAAAASSDTTRALLNTILQEFQHNSQEYTSTGEFKK